MHLELLENIINEEEWKNKPRHYVGYKPKDKPNVGDKEMTFFDYVEPPMPLVDLGLPSGTLWAKYNLGATSETDAGMYFQWADSQGYTADQVGTGEGKKKFAEDFSDYKWWDSNVTPEFEDIPENELSNYPEGVTQRLTKESANAGFTKYTGPTETGGDGKLVVEPSDDAATQMLGDNYRIPTREEWEELFAYDDETETYTNVNIDFSKMTGKGVHYIKVSNRSDNNKYIILPAAGGAFGGAVQDGGEEGIYWSSLLYSGLVQLACGGLFGSGGAGVNYGYRCSGCPIRCVGA